MAKPKSKTELKAAAKTLGLPSYGTKAEIVDRISKFGYNASVDKGRRQAPQTRPKHERRVKTPSVDRRIVATAQDQMRNQALIAWMVRLHLDYVSSFHFEFRAEKQDSLNKLVNRIFQWHGAPRNIDVAGRFGRDEIFRMFELEKVTTGDAALIKVLDADNNTFKLQTVEHDMIAQGASTKDNKIPAEVNEQGLFMDDFGGVKQYAICNRGDNGDSVVYDHMEDAFNVIFDAYWTRFGSQWRGVSPLTTALNAVQDLGEAFEYNLVKAKMHAMMGMAILRKSNDGDFGGMAGAEVETSDTDPTVPGTGSEMTLNPTEFSILDLNPDEDVKMLESGTPSTEFVEGSYLFIQIAMLALDIPVTFFDSRRSSFSARIADLNTYEVSAEPKRTKNRYVRQEYSDTLLASIWNDSESPWPLRRVAEAAGMSLMEVQTAVEWIPNGSPWIDKLKQVKGDELAIDIRIDNTQDAAKRRGGDAFENVDKTLAVELYEKTRRAELELPERVLGDPSKYMDEITEDNHE